MSVMAWKHEYSVGDRVLDEHHQKLFELLNDLHDRLLKRDKSLSVGDLLRSLINYTEIHFAAEEELMMAANYPERTLHHVEHEELTAEVTKLYSEWQAGRPALTLTVLTFLADWVHTHVLVSDARYASYIAATKQSIEVST